MGNFWRGAAEVGNALYDYVGDKKRWELADTQNALQKMKMEALQEEVVGRKAEGEALKGVSMYDTKTTEMPEYQGVVSPPNPNEGYAAPPESALIRQTTTQTPRSTIDVHREVANKLRAAGQGKMALMYDNAARAEEQNVHTNLWNSLKFAVDKGDDNMANSILETAPESFLQATGMKRGEKFSGGGQEYEMTKMASPSNPLSLPDGTVATEGNWLVKLDKRGRTVKADRKDLEKAPNTAFESFRSGMIKNGITDEKKIAEAYMTTSGDSRPINFQIYQSPTGPQMVNPRDPKAPPVPLGGGMKATAPDRVVTDLNNKAGAVIQLKDMIDTFKPEFGGGAVAGMGGPLATKIQEKVGTKQDKVNWFKNMKMIDNKLRNDLFGSALTATEKEEWRKSTFDENTHPDIIKKNLETRLKISNNALARDKQSFGKRYDLSDVADTNVSTSTTSYKVGGQYNGKTILGINPDTRQLNVEGLGVVSY